MQQYFCGIPVFGKYVIIAADESGNADALTANTVSIDLDKKSISDDKADDESIKESVFDGVQYQQLISFETLSNVILEKEDRTFALCKPVEYSYIDDGEFYSFLSFVDLIDYSVVKTINRIQNNINIGEADGENKAYTDIDASGRKTDGGEYILEDDERNIICAYLEGTDKPVTKTLSTVSDKDSVDLYVNTQKTYDFFKDVINIDSFDNNNTRLIVLISKSGVLYDNAKSTLLNSMAAAEQIGSKDYFGSGLILMGEQKELFKNSAADALDLLAHEFTHRVVHSIIELESKEINEGYADIFGNLVEYYSEGPRNNIWELGENTGYVKYDMSTPVSIKDFDETASGHSLAAVLSHSAYLMFNGIDGNADKKINIDTLAKLWYRSIYLLIPDATFSQCADSVIRASEQLYKSGTIQSKTQLDCIKEAFDKVGIAPASYQKVYCGSKLYVKDFDLNDYADYHLKIYSIKTNILSYAPKYEADTCIVDAEVKDKNGYSLNIDPGVYLIEVTDNNESGSKNKFTCSIILVDPDNPAGFSNCLNKCVINTDFGLYVKDTFPNTAFSNAIRRAHGQ